MVMGGRDCQRSLSDSCPVSQMGVLELQANFAFRAKSVVAETT